MDFFFSGSGFGLSFGSGSGLEPGMLFKKDISLYLIFLRAQDNFFFNTR
jgi:hypothetical protein